MEYYNSITKTHLLDLLDRVGMTRKQFCEAYWPTPNNHQTIEYFKNKGNIRLENLVRICEILNMTPNDILLKSDENRTVSPTINGDGNAVNSPNAHIELNCLKAELVAAQEQNALYAKIIEEKTKYIDFLMENFERKK